MSGLIFSALGQGISQAGGTIGSAMIRSYEREEDAARRERERKEDADLRRELAGARAGGATGGRAARGGGGGGGEEADLTSGSVSEERAAAAMGMDVPSFRQFRESQRTGDVSGYEQQGPTPDGGKLLPEQWIQQQRQKWATFLTEESKATSYNDLTSGRKNQQSVDLTQQAIESPEAAAAIGRARAAEKGQGPYKVQGNTKIDEFTGETSTTEVGKSIVDKNERPPAPKGGGGRGGGGSGNTNAVFKTVTDDGGNVIGIRRDGSKVDLGIKSGDFNKTIARMIAEREKNDFQFKGLSEEEKRSWALSRFPAGGSAPTRAPAKPGDNAAPSRPPLSTFMTR